MHRLRSAVIVFICVSYCGLLSAEETAYVTDSLQLRLYVEPSDSSEIIESIESGDSIEVLASQGAYSQVRTYDGSTGWVKSAFLVAEPPAKLLYYSVSEQNKQLEQQIQLLQNSSGSVNEVEVNQIAKLKQALEQQQKLNQQLQEQQTVLEQNKQSQETLEANNDQMDATPPMSAAKLFSNHTLLLAGLVVALSLFSFILGMKLPARRMRKRLHGFHLD